MPEAVQLIDVSRISAKLPKKCRKALDMPKQDAITPSLPGETNPPPVGNPAGWLVKRPDARIAQLVEQRIENPRVGGSNPPPGTIFLLVT